MENNKVLHVVNISFVIPYYIGDQFDYFQQKGYIFYVACSPSQHLNSYSNEKKFKPLPLQILREINVVKDVKAILQLRKIIKEENIGTVLGHTPKGALVGITAAWLAGVKKRVYFRHGIMYETSKGLKRAVLKMVERFSGMLATQVVCVSPSVMQISAEEGLSAEHKNIILNNGTCNGIDTTGKFNPDNYNASEVESLRTQSNINIEDKVIGYVGRLVNDKGINELIAAWKLMLQKHKNIKLLLVGPFEERDSIPEDVKEYITTEPSIIHTGLVPDTERYYSLMDAFILPSFREGFPTVVLEASAMGLPVITTRATGCRDAILENITGIFTERNATAIMAAVEVYLKHPGLIAEHGSNGREFVCRNFDQKVIWKEIENKVF